MDPTLILFVGTAFGAVAGIVFAAGQFVLEGSRLRRRLPVGEAQSAEQIEPSTGRFSAVLPARFAEDRLRIDDRLRQKLRLKLVRSGYFGQNVIRYYISARLVSVAAFPCAAIVVYALYRPNFSIFGVALLISIAAGAGIFAPDAYLSYRQSKQIREYRLNFPDLLDLLTVCVTAGLTVEKSFERIRDQLRKRSPALGRSIELMGAEMRAGRSVVDALASLADRLGLDEASSFVTVLRHSLELGGDIATSLRGFSDDMRMKRLILAEKRANELAVRMSLPLAFGIFPVILMIVLLPVILKLLQVISH